MGMVAHPRTGRELTQQGQNALRYLVGLCQNRGTSLLQDLSASHVGDFDCVVCVFNTRTSCGQVGDGVAQVGDRGLEAVLDCTEVATKIVDLLQGLVKRVQRFHINTGSSVRASNFSQCCSCGEVCNYTGAGVNSDFVVTITNFVIGT